MERRLIPLLSQSKVVDALSDTELAELIGQLSTVWLSLAVHAASIAKVEVRPNNVVVITVPPHPQIGTAIEDYIFRELLHAKADENLMKSIRGSFMHLGKYPQTLEVSTMPTGTGGHDKPFYFILHRYDAMPFGPLVVGSGLQVTQLGPYSVFLRSFPPLPQ